MPRTNKFQDKHTRSYKDWKYIQDETGRHCLIANGNGVNQRIGRYVNWLESNPNSSASELHEHMLTKDRSARLSDQKQAFCQMRKIGILKSTGSGKGMRYSLTAQGRGVWEIAHKVWL